MAHLRNWLELHVLHVLEKRRFFFLFRNGTRSCAEIRATPRSTLEYIKRTRTCNFNTSTLYRCTTSCATGASLLTFVLICSCPQSWAQDTSLCFAKCNTSPGGMMEFVPTSCVPDLTHIWVPYAYLNGSGAIKHSLLHEMYGTSPILEIILNGAFYPHEFACSQLR